MQPTTCFTSKSLGDATTGDLPKQLGILGTRRALLCVAVKQKLNRIAVTG